MAWGQGEYSAQKKIIHIFPAIQETYRMSSQASINRVWPSPMVSVVTIKFTPIKLFICDIFMQKVVMR